MKHLTYIQSKILNEEGLQHKLALWRFQGKRMVFTNGCFDLLHQGHLQSLTAARDMGDILIIGLNTDASVKRLKGQSRPIQDEHTRAMVLAALECVDAVVLFDEDTPQQLIEAVTPNILVKGGDYKAEEVVGYNHVTEHGGEVRIIPILEGHSTTATTKRMK